MEIKIIEADFKKRRLQQSSLSSHANLGMGERQEKKWELVC